MGWDFVCKIQSKKDYIESLVRPQEWTDEKGNKNFLETLDYVVKKDHMWSTVSHTTNDNIPVCLVVLDLIEKDGLYWGHKRIDETCGPLYYDCPTRLIELADEPINELSREWREEVSQYKESQKLAKTNS